MNQEAQAACLDEEAISDLLHGSLDESARVLALRHLAGCARCRLILARAAQGAFTTTSNDAGSVDMLESGSVTSSTEHAVAAEGGYAQPRVGDVIADKYRIEEVIGRGGMGIVFAALHVELGHRVAIKVLRHIGGQSIHRFMREAQTSVRFANEHVVRVFDLGYLPGSLPYILMEYLQGEDLAKLLVRGPVPARVALRYALEICDALQEAHAVGIVHRDLKPANVFLCDRGQGRRTIKVLDFGISKSLAAGLEPSLLTLTEINAVIGSPAYMSPEQMQALRDIDARTDIWSLGVVLYEMLSGKLPFRGRSFSALAIEIATREPQPLERDAPALAPSVAAIVARCLAKDRDERFQNVNELVEALEAARKELDEPGSQSQSKTLVATSPRVRLQPLWFAAALGLLALMGATLWWLQRDRVAMHEQASPQLPPASVQPDAAKRESSTSAISAPAEAPAIVKPPEPPASPVDAAKSGEAAKPRRPKPKPTPTQRPPDAPSLPGPTDTPD